MATSSRLILSTSLIVALLTASYSRNAVWHTGITLWIDAVKKNPNNRRAYSNLCTYYSAENNFKSGFEVCDKALSMRPETPDRYMLNAFINRGALFFGTGNYYRAMQDYLSALDLEPSNARIYNNLGNTYALLDKVKDALDSYSRAIAINPIYVLAYSNRGLLNRRIGKYDDAIQDLSRAIFLNPENAKFRVQRGLTYVDMKDTKNAAIDFTVACNDGSKEACGHLQKLVR